MPEFHSVCRIDEVPPGQARRFVVDEQVIGLFNIDGDFYATDDSCPHAGASLSLGTVQGDEVSCRIHHWRFCVRSGKYLDADFPMYNLRTYPTRLVDDQVEVLL